MPYCRRRFKKRTFGKRIGRRYGKQQRNRKLVTGKDEYPIERYARYVGAVGNVARTVMGIAKMVNTELKYHDTNGSGTQTNTLGVNYLSNLGTGTSDQTRTGNSILGKDLQVNYTITMNASATNTFFRIMIIVDKQCDGADPTGGSILSDPTRVTSPLNKDFTNRFVNLRDTVLSLSTSGNTNVSGKIYIKVPWHIYYDGSSSTNSSFKENQLFLIMLSNETTNPPTVTWNGRFNFYDN